MYCTLSLKGKWTDAVELKYKPVHWSTTPGKKCQRKNNYIINVEVCEYLNLGVFNKFLHNLNSTRVFEKAQKSESSFFQNESKQTTDKSYHLGANKQTWSVPQLFMVMKTLFTTATCSVGCGCYCR